MLAKLGHLSLPTWSVGQTLQKSPGQSPVCIIVQSVDCQAGRSHSLFTVKLCTGSIKGLQALMLWRACLKTITA